MGQDHGPFFSLEDLMSGLYNVVFGVCPYAGDLLSMLGVDNMAKIGRFRDCFLNTECTEAIIYTRTGGSNREDYLESTAYLRSLPGYLGDEDDPYDETYAIFRYEVPEGIKEYIPAILDRGLTKDVRTMWAEAIRKIQTDGR